MRIFLGIFPDEDLRAYFRDLKSSLSKYKQSLKFTPLDQNYMTVKFMGAKVSQKSFEVYAQSLQNKLSQEPRFTYSIEKISFGSKHQVKPTTLLANAKKSDQLDYLTQVASDIAKNIGTRDIISKKEHKKILHHYKLAKAKINPSAAYIFKLENTLKTMPIPPKSTTVDTLHFVKSELTNKGPVYSSIGKINLK